MTITYRTRDGLLAQSNHSLPDIKGFPAEVHLPLDWNLRKVGSLPEHRTYKFTDEYDKKNNPIYEEQVTTALGLLTLKWNKPWPITENHPSAAFSSSASTPDEEPAREELIRRKEAQDLAEFVKDGVVGLAQGVGEVMKERAS